MLFFHQVFDGILQWCLFLLHSRNNIITALTRSSQSTLNLFTFDWNGHIMSNFAIIVMLTMGNNCADILEETQMIKSEITILVRVYSL